MVFTLVLPLVATGQNPRVDSLRGILANTRSDTSRVLLLAQLSEAYNFYIVDSSEQVARRALQLARKIQFRKGEACALISIGHYLRETGRFPQALAITLQALKIAQDIQDAKGEALALFCLGTIYNSLEQHQQSVSYYRQSEMKFRLISDWEGIALCLANVAASYRFLQQPDSVQVILERTERILKTPLFRSTRLPSSHIPSSLMLNRGWLKGQKGNAPAMLPYYRKALSIANVDHNRRSQCIVQFSLAELFEQLHQTDSSLYYARLALRSSRYVLKNYELRIAILLARLHEAKGQIDSAYTESNLV